MIEATESQPGPLMVALNNPLKGEQLGLACWHSFTVNAVDARLFQAKNFGDERLPREYRPEWPCWLTKCNKQRATRNLRNSMVACIELGRTAQDLRHGAVQKEKEVGITYSNSI